MEIDLNKLTLDELEVVLRIAKRQKHLNEIGKNSKEPKKKEKTVKEKPKKRKTYKVGRRNKNWTKGEREKLHELHIRGWKAKKMAKELKRSPQAVYVKLADLGLKKYKR